MSHGPHGTIGVVALVAAIAFAFGQKPARIIVGGSLIVALLVFLYVLFRVATGTI